MPVGISREDLIELAKDIHQKDPQSCYHIFDDDAQFEQFKNWDVNYPDPAFPFPEEWAEKHHIANTQLMAETGGVKWGLYDGLGAEKIAPLD